VTKRERGRAEDGGKRRRTQLLDQTFWQAGKKKTSWERWSSAAEKTKHFARTAFGFAPLRRKVTVAFLTRASTELNGCKIMNGTNQKGKEKGKKKEKREATLVAHRERERREAQGRVKKGEANYKAYWVARKESGKGRV
jgi:hypothetical protein